MRESGFERIVSFRELVEGVPASLKLETGEDVCLIRVGHEVFGIAEECPHGESPLSDGAMVDDYVIECPMHCAQFDVRDGSVVEPPAIEPILVYEVKIVDGDVWVANGLR